MARFVEVLLVLFFLAKFNATNAINATNVTCTNDQFTCISSGKCIPSYQRCDGIVYVEQDPWTSGCEDGSDEDGCDFSSIIEESKRIVCGYYAFVDGLNDRLNYFPYENSTECIDDSYDECWWDDDSSKCYQKYPAKTGGLKCHSCHFEGLTRTDLTVECEKGDRYESCDIDLANFPWDGPATDPKQACITGTWWTRCGTVDDCENNPKVVSCCTTDYCNQLTIDNSDAQKILNDKNYIEETEISAMLPDLWQMETNFDKLLERNGEDDKSAEDNGSVMKLDLVAACIVAIISAMMTV